MKQLETSNAGPVWRFFSQICAIPHPSKHEQQLSLWIQHWAREKGLAVDEDATGNLKISKPATAGMENRAGVVMQAHLDMVPQKNSDSTHDFVTDPIRPYIDGEWVTADGTTLGADNGIGMASALAILDTDDVPHGPLEVLLTIDEEAGMTGAFNLQPGWFNGKILINTDSEQNGEVYMGCAGGVDANFNLPIEREVASGQMAAMKFELRGLKGGHSGCDIHLGRGTANQLMAQLLRHIGQQHTLQVSNFSGGSLRNAIAREADCELWVFATEQDEIQAKAEAFFSQHQQLLSVKEPTMSLAVSRVSSDTVPLSQTSSQQLINLLCALPHGVVRMSDSIEGVVETSTNLGVVRTEADTVSVQCLIRSLNDTGRQQIAEQHAAIAELSGASVSFDGAYPGWEPDTNSIAMTTVRETYQALFGKLPNIMVIHAGLECGLFKAAYPDWDMVSIGPTIRFPHSPDEKVEIASVDDYWTLLKGVLAAIPAA
ncbi:aminoacyl-histidine dipeptidase [Corallincola luteus]|uniref:Aminoacyl-histidine dipeptidase n=1 Tax=Corallincola luteus TaxID=1775177 RepID=A0ABY2APX5_9GAMM|nr:aminoacyl-histidine dipeptidase [Corallincola luteus]TCI05246.1 aminoacyl-histidine dipeptidase [Corallincola luteus]